MRVSYRLPGFLVAALTLACMLQGCQREQTEAPPSGPVNTATSQAPANDAKSIEIQHKLGSTVAPANPQRVVAYDMSVLDSLDQLGISIAGMPKDYVPNYLTTYKRDAAIADVGSVLQPNLEKLHATKPDLILISPLVAWSYEDLSKIAPTIYFDIDFMNAHGGFIKGAAEQLTTLGRVFGVEDRARDKIDEINQKVAAAKTVTKGRPERALIVMYNNGSFTAFGVQSRYGFIYDTLGVTPASTHIEPGMHGQPISNEFIVEADPDILYVIDRTAAVERHAANPADLNNPLIRQTKAWKNGRVVMADPDVWYLSGAGAGSVQTLIDQVLQGYEANPKRP
ncbi:siderophore ABC transporter substrate-binding protein [Comamonas composti]|uniref:siderophore ABC transporter substrate-binding protein n=1 Tax=Comamonas composti TaxID=408558 RepID=UPI0005505849|nr:siderophore ABC transporter substrate-binding protein [Comamonas composti]